MHSTNYYNTFIEVAEDCPTLEAQIPPTPKAAPSIAQIHFDQILANPYRYTSDDVIFGTFALRNGLEDSIPEARAQFFSKGQPCLRTSPLTKRYGWGIHHDEEGKVALFALESAEYKAFVSDSSIKKVKAMRSSRA